MKRSTRVFGDRVLRSGRRLFASRDEEEVKRIRVAALAVVDTKEKMIELLAHGCGGDAEVNEKGWHNSGREDGNGNGTNKAMEIDDEEQEREIKLGESKKLIGNGTVEAMGTVDEEQREIKLGESKKVYGNGTDEVMTIDDEGQQREIKLGESKKMSLVDHTHHDGDNVSQTKQLNTVYTRKRKRMVPRDSSLKCSSFEEKSGSDKRYEKKYFRKKVRTSLGSESCHSKLGFVGKNVLWQEPVVFVGPCSCSSGDSSSSIYQFSCFVSSILRYMREAKLFSWRQLSRFLSSELTTSVYSSIGIRFLQDSTCNMSHGFFKVFGCILSIPFFTVEFNSLPFCFLYMHSSLLLKYASHSYALIIHPTDENITDHYVCVCVASTLTTKRDQPLGRPIVVKKTRSQRKTVPRVSLFKKCWQGNVWADVESDVPVPGVSEISGYAEEEYVPFRLPDSYISSRSDEVTRTLEKSCATYDMDSDDEEWLKTFNNEHFGDNECVLEDTFEKIIDAYERGIYCSPYDYSDATSAVNRCLSLASNKVLGAVYGYWMTKRKKKRSALVRVFQCYRRKRVRQSSSNAAVLRKKRSSRRRASQRGGGKQLDLLEAMFNDQKIVEETTNAIVKVHEAQEAARRLEAAAIVKRQQAQSLVETADLVTYRAFMSLRIAEAREAAG